METILNKEKARELSDKYTKLVDYPLEQCLIEMAEWKDEEHAKEKQQLIKKAAKWNMYENEYVMVDDFKQAIKDNRTMTNEEKAKEIGRMWYYDNAQPNDAAYRGAVQMGIWKDEQEIEFLQSLLFQASTQQALGIIIKNRIKLLKG